MQPALSCLWSPKFSKSPDVRSFTPPSEDKMAAWLGAIVKGEELACCNDDDGSNRRPTTDDGRDVVPAVKWTSPTTAMDKKEKIPTTTTEGRMMGNKES
ncbi:unnamed protein product [Miscanthus lutarioriparius]|uniref:Uncharacterized protein n=1 Tax=Miscanthus lutarioriparius TaxID=422564 RepID=A0A811RB08_9POAL|nr:unnamed protein product [Miscanthus lutarioriparius]